ncbi:MAG: hypothetical protein MJ227_02240 [Bacilli bacterium]|nr:hypothetical protein [Bacilli bacterium]
MVVLRAIGGFFARIGRWIRDTAWVQPLLIVGGIFAIIFSIPYITKWVQSWFVKAEAGEVYYRQHTLSCEGAAEKNSEVDKLFTYMMNGRDDKDFATNAKKYGEKFFLMFGYDGCPGCETLYPAFSNAESEWYTTFGFDRTTDEYKFWYIDIASTDNEGNFLFISSEDKSIYSHYSMIFEKANTVAIESNYAKHTSDHSSYIDNADTNAHADSKDAFITPTLFIVDMKADSQALDYYGIENVLFNIPEADLPKGETSQLNYIQFLTTAWKQTVLFSESGEEVK